MAGPQFRDGDFCHIEIPGADPKQERAFFAGVFGWKFQDVPNMDYATYMTPGEQLGGGVWRPPAGMPSATVNYLFASDIETTLDRINQAGGKTVKTTQEIPGVGWFALFSDPAGNVFGLFKPRMG